MGRYSNVDTRTKRKLLTLTRVERLHLTDNIAQCNVSTFRSSTVFYLDKSVRKSLSYNHDGWNTYQLRVIELHSG